jgi:hypothetical protein
MGVRMIVINMDKAKAVGHDLRRLKRAEEFAPWDLKATIPSESAAAEAARQAIRDKYAAIQQNIDAAETPEAIKAALEQA